MAASEVALSLAIVRLHDLLSKFEDITTYQKFKDQIRGYISNLQRILSTRKHAVVISDYNQETPEGKDRLWLWARDAEQIAEEFVVKLLRHQMSKSQKGRLTKVFDQVRFFSVMNRGSAKKKMAEDFMMTFKLLSGEFTSSQTPAKGLPGNEKTSASPLSKSNPENTRQRIESDIVGRGEYVERLLAFLNVRKKDDVSNLRVISVVGKQACGKTALVRSVFNELEVKHHFDCRAWVRFTDLWAESYRMKNILVEILKQSPLQDQAKDLEHKQEEQLFEMLHKSLMDLRYLIVVDNLHETSLINKLLVPFVDSSKGSRVIVTTTNEVMQKFADPWTPDLQLRPDLTSREPEELLRVSIMGGGDSVGNDLESKMTILKERILSKCNGSPPAISLLGGLLSAAEESNCEALIDRLGDRPTLDDIRSLSFDELPYMMKPRLLYMALFPEESEVPTRRLFRQWAAEGLLAEAAAEDCLHELEMRNFIHVVQRKLDGSARSCRMPAFLHEFFTRKAEDLGLLRIQYSSDSVSEKESRGMESAAEQSAQNIQKQVQNTETGHSGYKVRCLRSFASFNTCKLGSQAREIKDLFNSPLLDIRQDLLRVIDLEGVYKPVLPKKFGDELPNLRYLGLRGTVLGSIPESVRNLLLLETLDLKHTNITKITGAIWNAKNLRHLYLSEASFDKSIPRQIISEMPSNSKLETLWGLLIESNKSPMISVLKNLKSLKKLGVTCRPKAVEAVTKCLPNLTQLESLRLRSRDLLGQPASLDRICLDRGTSSSTKEPNPCWPGSLSKLYLLGSLRPAKDFFVLPENLRMLTLSMSDLKDDPMPRLGCLSNLIVLRLLARSYTGVSSPKPQSQNTRLHCQKGFTKLRILKLWKLDELEELTVEQGVMCNLEELEIRQCEKLQRVSGLGPINSLKSVCLTRVKKALAEELAEGRGPPGPPQHTLVQAKELVQEKECESKK